MPSVRRAVMAHRGEHSRPSLSGRQLQPLALRQLPLHANQRRIAAPGKAQDRLTGRRASSCGPFGFGGLGGHIDQRAALRVPGPRGVGHSHPANVRAQLFARDGALGGLLDGWAAFNRRLPHSAGPLPDQL